MTLNVDWRRATGCYLLFSETHKTKNKIRSNNTAGNVYCETPKSDTSSLPSRSFPKIFNK